MEVLLPLLFIVMINLLIKIPKVIIGLVIFITVVVVVYLIATEGAAITVATIVAIMITCLILILVVRQLRSVVSERNRRVFVFVGVGVMVLMLIITHSIKKAFVATIIVLCVGAILLVIAFIHSNVIKRVPYIRSVLYGESGQGLAYRIKYTCGYALVLLLFLCGIILAVKYLFHLALTSIMN